jgi:tight adherence protein C
MESRRAIIEKADKGRSLTAESLLALEVFSTVLFGALAVLGAILGKPGLPQSILLIFAGLLIGARLPIFVLERMGSARVERIEAQLPDALDLITISVEAGLTIQGALRKLVETVDNDLTLEFRRALAEYDLGGNLFDTLRRRADEVVVPSLQAVTRALTQSSKLGTSLGQLLRVQSEKVRRNRRARAQERAQKAPVKMLFPMVGCIFPTIFAVLLGPAAVNLVVNH